MANSLSYPQGEDGACVERDEVLDINTEKVKTNRSEAVLDVFPKQPFSCACPKGYVGKV